MRSRYWLILLAAGPATAFAGWGGCEFRADRASGVDARGVEKVVIRTGAGDMKVVGRGNAVRVEARGTACAAKQELLEQTRISVRRDGNVVYVETDMPQSEGFDWGRNNYAYIDIGIALPSNIPVEAVDSSGDAVFEDLQALQFNDSSGDIDISRIAALADITDSSGDIEIESAGSVRVSDSSGDIEIEDIRGDVHVVQDSSGDIRVETVAGNVRVEQDSSGDIRAENVKGSFTVDSDSSGSIYAANVTGDFTVLDDSSGDIDHSSIGGKVTIPADKRGDEDVER